MFNSLGSGNDYSSEMGDSKITESLLDCLQVTLLFNFIIFVTERVLSQHDRFVIIFIFLSAMFSFSPPLSLQQALSSFCFCSEHAVGTQKNKKY